MEKVNGFPDLYRLLFGINIEDMSGEVITEMVRMLIQSNNRAEAFLLAYYQYKIGKNDIHLRQMEEAAKIRFDFGCMVKNSKDKDGFISRMQRNRKFLSTYSELLTYYCAHSRSDSIVISFLLASKRLRGSSPEEIAFIERIDELRYSQKTSAVSAWTAMYTYTSNLDLQSPYGIEFLDHLIHKITGYGFGSLMPLFYWYHCYLGNTEIADKIFASFDESVAIELTYNPFLKGGYLWARETSESFERRYLELSKNPREIKRDLAENAMSTLVPLCLYAKERGDIEMEAQLLLVVMINNKVGPGLVKRMYEICGRQIPSKFDKLKVGIARDQWISSKFYHCDNIVKTGIVDEIGIESCRRLYPFKAFDSIVIKALIKINAEFPNDDIQYVIKLRIGRTTVPTHLGSLLNFAVMAKNRYVVKLILLRLFILGYLNSILKTAEIIKDGLGDSHKEQWQILSEVLDFYAVAASKNQIDVKRCEKLKQHVLRNRQYKWLRGMNILLSILGLLKMSLCL
jgi:hypothetical protein